MKPIDNLLRQRLYRTQTPLIEHPPMDLLSAFSERALSGSERTPVLDHLAHCADCREILFLAAPDAAAEMVPAQKRVSPSTSGWISWPVFRWGTVAACAVVVVAGMRMHPGYRATQPGEITAVVQDHRPAAANQSSQSGESSEGGGQPTTTKSVEIVPAQQNAINPITVPVRRLHTMPGKAKDAPQIPAAQPGNTSARQMAFATDGVSNRTSLTKLAPRWTLTANGALQRSLDGGISWQQIQVSHDRVFRAVAAAGRTVWLGGQQGALFHSADAGQHWKQLKPTAQKPLPTSDIIGIEFEDDQNGKLTTASNESWTTSDAGLTWEKQ